MATAAPARLAVLLFLTLGLLLPTATRADAQDEKWSFVITPQVWVPHIEKNGFAPPGAIGGSFAICANPRGSGNCENNSFQGENSTPVDEFNPQWGVQLAAQKGRWTLAGSFQYVSFTTQSDLILRSLPKGTTV